MSCCGWNRYDPMYNTNGVRCGCQSTNYNYNMGFEQARIIDLREIMLRIESKLDVLIEKVGTEMGAGDGDEATSDG